MNFSSKCICLLLVILSFGLKVAIAQDQCLVEAKEVSYTSFLKNRTIDQAKAYEDAKKYLSCQTSQRTEAEQKIVAYLKEWSTAYEDGLRKERFKQLLYEEKKCSEAYVLAKEILAKQPDDLNTLVHAGANGYELVALNDPSLTAQALDYATRALQQLDSGKNLDDWQPLTSRYVALAYLNYTVGVSTLQNDPSSALNYLIKSAQFETPLKQSPLMYGYIAQAYEDGDYAKQSEVYNRNFAGKDETWQSKLALANVNQTVDRLIDAYARAVALAGDDPKFAKIKAKWSETLTLFYKYSNNGTAGLKQLIADVLSKPLPSPPTPLTTIPQ